MSRSVGTLLRSALAPADLEAVAARKVAAARPKPAPKQRSKFASELIAAITASAEQQPMCADHSDLPAFKGSKTTADHVGAAQLRRLWRPHRKALRGSFDVALARDVRRRVWAAVDGLKRRGMMGMRCWNTMLACVVASGSVADVRRVEREMEEAGISPDRSTWNSKIVGGQVRAARRPALGTGPRRRHRYR
eukprot:TRINITY_DN11871_c0_g1_i1.p2 TRINITY_DN11871_c0_g1~~TRINITY_DN11871_c0_g1_i1.p2  ORF type:complete len:192 (+),score=60.98 TRINITY_DN11871_c0_g1_i1:43-618(+)